MQGAGRFVQEAEDQGKKRSLRLKRGGFTTVKHERDMENSDNFCDLKKYVEKKAGICYNTEKREKRMAERVYFPGAGGIKIIQKAIL